jgi:hypothetical protein
MRAIPYLRGRRQTFMDRWRLPGSNSRNSATSAAKVHDETWLNRCLSNASLRGICLSAYRLRYDMATNDSVRNTGSSTAQSKRVICPSHLKSAIALPTCCVFASCKSQPFFKKSKIVSVNTLYMEYEDKTQCSIVGYVRLFHATIALPLGKIT